MFTAPNVLTGVEALLLAAVAAALVASTLAAAPTTVWGIVSDIRAAHRLSTRDAERLGVEENGIDTSLTDRVAAIIPKQQTYALVLSDRLVADQALVFRLWTISALLPRIAVGERGSADWIVSWGVTPRELGAQVEEVHVLEPRRDSDPPLYVARVVR